ncbi:unnamed protein product, partial [Mesorhabditis belari]
AAACLEIQYSRKWPDYEFIDLSEQEMSCVYPNKKTICKGGSPTNAFYHYMRGKGIGFEEDWPYNPYGDQTCYTEEFLMWIVMRIQIWEGMLWLSLAMVLKADGRIGF